MASAAFATLAAALLLFHPTSLSSTRIEVRGSEATLTMRLQGLSLLEVVDGLDADGDGFVTAAEVEDRRDAILSYVASHYLLRAGGHALDPEPVDVTHRPAGVEGGITYRAGVVDVTLSYAGDRPLGELVVEMDLFRETSPYHVDLCTIDWNGETTETLALDYRAPTGQSDAAGGGAFGVYLELGFRHILGGWDHLAFLVALILASRRLRSLLGVVTAFTVAHSATLALSALGVVNLSAHVPLIEMAIALSIAYVAADTLLHPDATRARWIEAFAFGLLHGLGFASFLGQSLVQEKVRVVALLSFNLGVEIGQVLVAVAVVAALRLLPRHAQGDEPFLAPRVMRLGGSAVIALLGLYWFAVRLC